MLGYSLAPASSQNHGDVITGLLGQEMGSRRCYSNKSVCSQAAPRAILTAKQHSSHSRAGAVSSAVSFMGNHLAAVRPKSSSPFAHKRRRDPQRLHSSSTAASCPPTCGDPQLNHLPLLCMECRKMGPDSHCPWVSTAWPGALPPGATQVLSRLVLRRSRPQLL